MHAGTSTLQRVAERVVLTLAATILLPPITIAAGSPPETGRESVVARKVAALEEVGQLYVAFSADSSRVITGTGFSDALEVWEWRQGTPEHHSLNTGAGSHTGAKQLIAFSRDGRFMAAAHDPGRERPDSPTGDCKTIKVWNAKTESPLVDLDAFPAWCSSRGILFSNDGALLFQIEARRDACKESSEDIVAFSTRDWRRAWDVCVGIDKLEIQTLSISPDDKVIAIGALQFVERNPHPADLPLLRDHPVVCLIDVRTHRVIRVLDGSVPDDMWIGALAWSPDGKILAVGLKNTLGDSRTDAVRLIDPKSGNLIQSENAAYSDIEGLAYTSDGKYLVEGTVNKAVRIWDGSHQHLLQSIPVGWGSVFADPLNALALSPDNRYLAITQNDETTIYELK